MAAAVELAALTGRAEVNAALGVAAAAGRLAEDDLLAIVRHRAQGAPSAELVVADRDAFGPRRHRRLGGVRRIEPAIATTRATTAAVGPDRPFIVEQAATALARLEGWLASGDPAATAEGAHACSGGEDNQLRGVARWVGTLAELLRHRIEEANTWS